MNLSPYEAETIINFNEEEGVAQIYTASNRVYKLLTRRGLEAIKGDEDNGWVFEVPKTSIALRAGRNLIKIGGTKKSGLSITPNFNSAKKCDQEF